MSLRKIVSRWLGRRSLQERHARLSDRLEDIEHTLTFARQELCRLERRTHKDKRAIRKAGRRVEHLKRVVKRLQDVTERLGKLL